MGQLSITNTDELSDWLASRNKSCDMRVKRISLQESKEWLFDNYKICRRDHFFFSVVGTEVRKCGIRLPHLDQPLIHQPEIGILGFLLFRGHAGREILVQCKPEPGNIPLCQLAPTVQATVSNYTRKHNGKATAYLEHFTGRNKGTLFSDTLQSEQGTRFLGKYNRNLVIEVPSGDKPRENENTKWVPIESLTHLLKNDFTINTDARSVLSCTPWHLLSQNGKPFDRLKQTNDLALLFRESYLATENRSELTLNALLNQLKESRTRSQLQVNIQSLHNLTDWIIDPYGVAPRGENSLSIAHYSIETTERETERWDQPFACSAQTGLVVLLCQIRKGIMHFLFRCKTEVGFTKGCQYCPTIQEYSDSSENISDFDLVQTGLKQHFESGNVLFSCLHSDEGGRFYQCVTKYQICKINKDDYLEPDKTLAWMTLNQIESLLARDGIFSNEARTLVSMLLAYV
jgi:oxidase EvaA